MNKKKYALTYNYIYVNGKKLYQIEALIDFADVKKGTLGGYVESETNLSQEGTCWIYNPCMISGDVVISGAQKIK